MSPCSGCGGERIQDVMAELMPGAGMAPKPLSNWGVLPPAVSKRIDRVLSSWVETPFKAGQRVRGGGVDCVQLVCAFLDEMARVEQPTVIPRNRSAMHGRRHGFPTVKAMRRVHPVQIVRDEWREPGDVIVVRSELQADAAMNLGHALILGVRPNTALHAIGSGVAWTSLQQFPVILRVYRPLGKESWA